MTHTHGTRIEWTHAPGFKGETWNVINGCELKSEGCRNCYAADLATTRLKNHPSREGLARRNADGVAKFNGKVKLVDHLVTAPLRWKKPRMVFVCAHGDLFYERVPDEWIDRLFAVMALCPQHVFIVLTKRPERMRDYFAETWQPAPARTITAGGRSLHIPAEQRPGDRWDQINRAIDSLTMEPVFDQDRFWTEDGAVIGRPVWPRKPLPNVWLGVSVENQATADERIPLLLDTPAAIRWVSAEPLLGPVDLTQIEVGDGSFNALQPDTWLQLWDECWKGLGDGGVDADFHSFCDWHNVHFSSIADIPNTPVTPALDWVVVGGESGDHARPMHPDWARQLRDQCAAAGVPFLFKQWGAWLPFRQSGFTRWDAENRTASAHMKRWMGRAQFDDGAGGPVTSVIAPVETCNVYPSSGDHVGGVQAVKIGKKRAGRLLDGRTHDAWPEAR